jgi:hypothetical protein
MMDRLASSIIDPIIRIRAQSMNDWHSHLPLIRLEIMIMIIGNDNDTWSTFRFTFTVEIEIGIGIGRLGSRTDLEKELAR